MCCIFVDNRRATYNGKQYAFIKSRKPQCVGCAFFKNNRCEEPEPFRDSAWTFDEVDCYEQRNHIWCELEPVKRKRNHFRGVTKMVGK